MCIITSTIISGIYWNMNLVKIRSLYLLFFFLLGYSAIKQTKHEKVWITNFSWFVIISWQYLSVILTFCIWYHRLILLISANWRWYWQLSVKVISNIHIMTIQIKTITAVLKDLTYIITSISAFTIRLAVILEMMSVSTFITTVILYISAIKSWNLLFKKKSLIFT